MAESKPFYFSDGPYLQVMQNLHAALSMPEAFIKLVGNPHTGKSLLCHKFSQFLKRKNFHVIYFDTAIESPDILRGLLAREFDLPESSNFARLLEDALRLKAEKPVVLIFDDAHLLTDITLLEIYRLAEIQADTQRMLNIVLCGEPSLDKRLLSNKEFKSLLLNVSHRFQLEPMDLEELGRFFYRFVEKAGLPGLQMDAAAMGAFYKVSKGYPAAALSMCKLLVASKAADSSLTPISKEEFQRLLRQASEDEVMPNAGYLENYRQLSQVGHLVPIAVVLVIASIGLLYQQLNREQAENESPIATIMPSDNQNSPFSEPVESAGNTNSVLESDAEIVSVTPELPGASATENRPIIDQPNDAPAATLEEPVSDSSLVLVTAQERGVATEAISIPEYEELLEESQSDDQTEIPASQASAPEMPDVEPDSDDLVTAAPVVARIQPPNSVAEEPLVVAQVEGPAVQIEQQERQSFSDDRTEIASSNPSSSMSLTDELANAVDMWVAAWQSQSLPDYFESYHSDFAPRYQDSIADWRSNRQRVIGGAEWIRLALTDFEFVGEEEGALEVRFWLRYESPNYSDETQKKLLMLQEQGTWKIKEEINLRVRS